MSNDKNFSETFYKSILDLSSEAIRIVGLDKKILFANNTYAELHKINTSEIIDKPCRDFICSGNCEDNNCSVDRFSNDVKEISKEVELEISGEKRYFFIHIKPFYSDNKLLGLYEYFRDVSENIQKNERIRRELVINNALAKISKTILDGKGIDEVSYSTLNWLKKITGSKFGFVGYLDDATGYLICPTFTRDIWEACKMEDKQVVFKEFKGLWGWVLNNKKPLLTNNASDDYRAEGLPKGHIPVERFMGVPVIAGEKLLGIIALANANKDYSNYELQVTNRISEYFALALQLKNTEKELIENNKKFQLIFENTPDAIFWADVKTGKIIHCNKAAGRLIEAPVNTILGMSQENLHPAHIRNEIMAAFKKGIERAEVFLESQVLTAKNNIVPVEITGNVIKFGDLTIAQGIFRDITERKIAEINLRESENKYRTYIESSPVSVFIADENGTYRYINQTAAKMLGYKKEEVIGKKLSSFLSDDTKKEALSGYAQLLEEGKLTGEYVLLHKRGTKIYVKLNAVRIDEDQYIAFCDDITARRYAEEALKESEARYKSLFYENHSVMLLIDPVNGEIVDVNETACIFYGYSKSDFTGKNIQEINTLSEKEVKTEMQKAKAMQRNHFLFKHKLANGDVRDVEVYTGCVFFRNKPFLYSIVYDITERKKAEDELHQYKTKLEELVEIRTKDFLRSEKRFKQLIEQMDDWVWQVDAEGNYTYSSPSVHKMLAYNVDEILPMNLFGLVIESEKENARKMFFEHAAGKTPVTGFEKTVQDKDGRLKVLETSATPVINEKNKLVGYFGVDRDVTERKNMEKKIVKTIIETESNERERFAKDLHDGLGTSLSGIRMYLNILQREQLDSKKRLEFLEKTIRLIEEAAASSRQIANNIRPHELNELGLVVGIESLVEKIAGSGDLTINLKTKYYSLAIDKDVELVLFRVVSELINNTIKHANAKNISINLFNSQKLLFLVYSDDGAGFDVDEKLFNQKDGMGLGNIVARIKSLRGKCDIAAVKGSGMDCTIELNIENII